jgi:hypothetical protein
MSYEVRRTAPCHEFMAGVNIGCWTSRRKHLPPLSFSCPQAEEPWQVTVRASGESLMVFLKGYHPFATQGGATLFDDVRVVDEGD